METLQVPTRAIDVELRIGHGESIQGRMFVSECGRQRASTELLLELLNDDREFVPVLAKEPEHGQISLNKRHIVSVTPTAMSTGERQQSTAADPGDSDEPCSLWLSDDEMLTGRLRVATPWSASRVLDKLNQAPRFVPIVTADGLAIVHGSHIVRVG